jgi:hypothetical protein
MDAPEDRDIKLQKVSGDLLLQFRESLPRLLYAAPRTETVRSTVDKNEVDVLIVLVRFDLPYYSSVYLRDSA